MSFLENIVNGIKGVLPQNTSIQENVLKSGINQNAVPQQITQAQLNAYKNNINPADYTTQLNQNEQAQFNNWANTMRQNGKINTNDNFQDYDMQGYWKNEVMPYDNLAAQGYDQAVINGVKQGLNGGNKDLAAFIQQQGIRTPQTQEEIAQARQGTFNGETYDPNSGHFTDRYKMPNHETFSNESQYYNDNNKQYAGSWNGDQFVSPVTTEQQQNNVVNALQKLRPSNWDEETRQKVMLVSQFLSGLGAANIDTNGNPWANISKAVSSGTQSAINQMHNYQNYQNTKNLYNQMGLDSSGLSPIADYSSMTPAQIINLGIKQQSNNIRQEIANANDNTKRLNLIMNGLRNGTISAEEAQAQAKLYGIDFSSMNESNETKRTNSQIEVNNARVNQINASIQQNERRLSILQQRVNQGKATSSDKEELNRLNIENKKLIIEQNKLINEGMRDQLNNIGDPLNNGEEQPKVRPLGQRKQYKDLAF